MKNIKNSESQSASCSLYTGAQLDQIKVNLYNFFISTTLPTSLNTTNCTGQFTAMLAAVIEGSIHPPLDPTTPFCTMLATASFLCGPNCAFVNRSLQGAQLFILDDMAFMAQNLPSSPTPPALAQLMNILTAPDCLNAFDSTNSTMLQNFNTYILNGSAGKTTNDNWQAYFMPFYNWLLNMDISCPSCQGCSTEEQCCCGICVSNSLPVALFACSSFYCDPSVSNCIDDLCCSNTQSCNFPTPGLDLFPNSCCTLNESCIQNGCCNKDNICAPNTSYSACWDPSTQVCINNTKVCNIGNNICGPNNTCYNTSTQVCSNNVICNIGQEACGTVCYNTSTQVCVNNTTICDNPNNAVCGENSTCYNDKVDGCYDNNTLICPLNTWCEGAGECCTGADNICCLDGYSNKTICAATTGFYDDNPNKLKCCTSKEGIACGKTCCRTGWNAQLFCCSLGGCCISPCLSTPPIDFCSI